jgi:hypothetical protein
MTKTERPQNLEKLTRAVVKVGDGGRGFVIETVPEDRIVITNSAQRRKYT